VYIFGEKHEMSKVFAQTLIHTTPFEIEIGSMVLVAMLVLFGYLDITLVRSLFPSITLVRPLQN
jgi:hypothetical protein